MRLFVILKEKNWKAWEDFLYLLLLLVLLVVGCCSGVVLSEVSPLLPSYHDVLATKQC